MAHTQNGLTTKGYGLSLPIVAVRVELIAHLIQSAAADIRRTGRPVTHQTLAQYTDMPEYLIRRFVDIAEQLDG